MLLLKSFDESNHSLVLLMFLQRLYTKLYVLRLALSNVRVQVKAPP